MKKIYISILLTASLCAFLSAQNIEPLWVRAERTDGQYVKLRADSSGNIIAFGNTYDPGPVTGIVTMKYDPDGHLLWKTTYDTYAIESPIDCVVNPEGDVYILGNGTDPFTNFSRFVLIKYSSEGDTLWTFFYGGMAAITNNAQRLLLDKAGNVYIAGGAQYIDQNDAGLLLLKINPLGEIVWEATLRDGPYGYGAMDARQIGKHIFLWGRTGSPEGTRFICWEVDMEGLTVAYHLTVPYSESFDSSTKNYEIDNEGNFIVGDVCCEYRAVKFLKNGNTAWEYNKPFTFSPLPTVPARLTSFAINNENAVYFGGSFYQSDTIGRGSLITKLDASGNLIWEHLFALGKDKTLGLDQLVLDGQGVLGVGSATKNDGKNHFEFLIVNYASNGDKKLAGISDLDSVKNNAIAVILLQDAFYAAGTRWLDLKREQLLAKYSRPTVGTIAPYPLSEVPVSVFPSPFSEVFTVLFEQLDRNQSGHLVLLDATGKVLLQKRVELTTGKNEFPLQLGAAFPKGIYYVSLQAGEHRYTVRLVKAE